MERRLLARPFATAVFAVGGLLFCSCGGGKLSRSDAAHQISQKLQLPAAQTTRIPRIALNTATNTPSGGGFMPAITICQDLGTQWRDVRERIEALRDKGLVTLGQKIQNNGDCRFEYTTISLTPEGQRYLVAQREDGYAVRTHTLVLGEVTGIRVMDQLKIAEAQYTLKVQDVTPFAGDLSIQPEQKSAAFQLFDDGWRIQ